MLVEAVVQTGLIQCYESIGVYTEPFERVFIKASNPKSNSSATRHDSCQQRPRLRWRINEGVEGSLLGSLD